MRTTVVLWLLLVLITVPAAQAQQTAAPARDARPAPRVVETPLPAQQMVTAEATAGVIQPKAEVGEVVARREMSARTLLAVLGGAVIAVALIVLLR